MFYIFVSFFSKLVKLYTFLLTSSLLCVLINCSYIGSINDSKTVDVKQRCNHIISICQLRNVEVFLFAQLHSWTVRTAVEHKNIIGVEEFLLCGHLTL